MKKLIILGLLFFCSINCSYAVITPDDYKEVISITKKLKKLSNKNDIEGISKYYSENYKSFDGYNKKEMLEIVDAANRLYPNIKVREKITKVETKDDYIKIFVTENAKIKLKVEGDDAVYASRKKVKGELKSNTDYAVVFKKENDKWLIFEDEIFYEVTDIRYGEAIKTDFDMEVPKNIKPGVEYTVKTTLDIPENRLVVGSIGHDKIVYPPKKYFDPYRTINSSGILERIMIANKDGTNEYANSTFAFIAPCTIKNKKEEIYKAAISGMGISVKRINISKEVL